MGSYQSDSTLKSKGSKGGKYSFEDESSQTGEWTYRIVDTDKSGRSTVLCQATVDVQSSGDKTVNTVAVGGLVLIFAGLAFAGLSLDPIK